MNKFKSLNEPYERIRQSEERLLALMKATSDVIYRMSPDWKTMSELYGRGFLEDTQDPDPEWLDKYIHPQDQAFVLSVIDECIHDKRTFELEHRVLRADGNIGWTFSRAISLLDGKGEIREWFGAASDITERKRMEAALKISEANLRAMFDHSLIGIIFGDMEGRVLQSNPAIERMLRYSKDELFGMAFSEFTHPDDLSIEMPMVNELIEGRRDYYEVEKRYIRKDGQIIWIKLIGTGMYGGNGERLGLAMIEEITKRKQAEEMLSNRTAELEEANRQKEDILESISDCFYALDRDLRFTYVNKAAEDIWDIPRADLLGRNIGEVFPNLIDISLSKFKQVLDEQTPQYYEVFSKVALKWGYMSVYPAPDGISVYFHDITERKKAEEALRESEEKFRVTQELSPDGFAIIRPLRDSAGAVTDFLWIYENDAAARMNDTNPKEVCGKRVSEVMPHHDQSPFGKAYKEVAETGEIRVVEEASYDQDTLRQLRWFRVVAVPTAGRDVAILVQDVTDRKWAGEALRESEAGQRFLLRFGDTLRSLINEKDILQTASRLLGEYLDADHAFFGELYLEENLAIMLPDYARGDLPSLAGRFKISDFQETVDALEGGQPYVIHDVANSELLSEQTRSAYLALGYASFFSVPLFKQGKLVLDLSAVSSEARNWTADQIQLAQEVAERTWTMVERTRAEDALRESEKKALELVEVLKETDSNKNQFISALSHELRNPLAVISMGLEIIGLTQDKEQIWKTNDIMSRQMRQLCALVDDLLDLTRISNNRIELKKEVLELSSLVLSTAEEQRALFDEKGVGLHTRICDEPIYIDADTVRIKQIIGNLLHNAQKYTPAGGEVLLSVCRENKQAVISVKDNGMGLSPELIPRLFHPFVQADMTLDRSGGGLGLGLSITKGIAEMHGGSVAAYSGGGGQGSEFVIRLPLS